MRSSIRATVVLILLGAAAGAARADKPVAVAAVDPAPAAAPAGEDLAAGRHVPPAEARAGDAIPLVVTSPATGPAPMLHYRARGAAKWTDVELVRREDGAWVTSIPSGAAAPPAVEYYVDRDGAAVFASAAIPHPVIVRAEGDPRRRALDLAAVRGRRSRVHVAGEWVDFGRTEIGAGTFRDQYYRIDADFAYRLLAYPLEEIRVGYTRLIGFTADCGGGPCVETRAGYKVGGWFELGVGPTRGVHADGRLLVLATAEGFTVGGRGELRLGDRDGSHVAIGGEYAADVGATGFFRLGWNTVPSVPMAATVEVGTLPSIDRPTGVRLIYDAFIPGITGMNAS
jgi:hypothetical protein